MQSTTLQNVSIEIFCFHEDHECGLLDLKINEYKREIAIYGASSDLEIFGIPVLEYIQVTLNTPKENIEFPKQFNICCSDDDFDSFCTYLTGLMYLQEEESLQEATEHDTNCQFNETGYKYLLQNLNAYIEG